ncbi:MAG: NAD(P)/FAD-dependent oxidoreductase [Spirochaetales bacterium]
MKKIAILGAGYGGVQAAKQLHKLFKKEKDVEITLYDRNPFHTLMTELHEVAGGRCEPESVQVSLEKIFGGTTVSVVIDTIKDISFAKNTLNGVEATYKYDYLVLGPGAEPEYFGIKGAKENSFALWSYNDAVRLRHHIEAQFLKASREPNTMKRRKILTFTVAGAGFTGMEMLGELLEWKKPLCQRYGVDENDVSIVMVEAMTEILPILPKKLRENTMRFLARKGAILHLNTPITEVRTDGITVKGGSAIDTETLIWTCGVRGPEFASKLDFTGGKDSGKPAATEEETNLKFNIVKKARLRSNEFMQSVEFDNVYLVGDVLWFSEKNRILPQVVETALQTAECAAHNIYSDVHSKPKKAFRSNYHGFLVSVGSKFAVAHVMGMLLTGFMAMAMKHLVNLHYLWEVAGVNACWEYLQHHFFTVKDGRSQVGNQLAAKMPSYWMLPIRVGLGLMWLGEAVAKVFEGWLNADKGTSSAWMFSPGVVQPGVDPDSLAGATEVVAKKEIHDLLGFMAQPILPKDLFLVQWMQWFMDNVLSLVPYMLLQVPVVFLEGLVGLALLGGTFTWIGAIASLALSVNFLFAGTLTWNSAWMLFASVALLGGAGKVLGLDAWIMPWLQRWWNRTLFAKRTYWYLGDARKRK